MGMYSMAILDLMLTLFDHRYEEEFLRTKTFVLNF